MCRYAILFVRKYYDTFRFALIVYGPLLIQHIKNNIVDDDEYIIARVEYAKTGCRTLYAASKYVAMALQYVLRGDRTFFHSLRLNGWNSVESENGQIIKRNISARWTCNIIRVRVRSLNIHFSYTRIKRPDLVIYNTRRYNLYPFYLTARFQWK